MPLLPQLTDPQPLVACLQKIGRPAPDWTWLFIARDTAHVTPDLPCHPQAVDSDQMSEEEADAFEQAVDGVGLKPFLSVDQLEDIVHNLRGQRPCFGEGDLIAAIDYYWKHDAFLTPDGDAA